jgi:O-antigen/teichoic acid export membrane protein
MSSGRSILKSSSLYVILGFLPMGVNFLLAPVYTEFLPPSENGLVALGAMVQSLSMILAGLALDGAFNRYYFQYYKKPQLVRALMSTSLLTVLGVSLLMFGLFSLLGEGLLDLAFKNKIFTYHDYGRYAFVTGVASCIHAFFLAYYRNQENVRAFAVVSMSFFFLSVAGILIGIIPLEGGARGSIIGRMSGASLVACCLVVFFFSQGKIYYRKRFLRPLFIYSLPLVVYLLLMTVYNQLDRFMVERLLDMDTLGQYQFAAVLGTTIMVLNSSIFNAISPRIYKYLSDDEEAFTQRIRQIQVAFQAVMMGFVALGAAVVVPFVYLFINEAYHPIDRYAGLIFLTYIPYTYYVIYAIPLFFYKKTKVLPYISLSALLVGIAVNLWLVPILGVLGVVVGLFSIKLVQFLAVLVALRHFGLHQKKYLHLPKNHLLSLLMLLSFGGASLLNDQYQWLDTVWLNLLPILLYIPLLIGLFRTEIRKGWEMVRRR